MNETTLTRQCPVCGNKTGEVLHEQSFILPSDSPLPSSYNIVYCHNCGFVFADTPVNQSVYNDYYQRLSKYEDLSMATGGGANEFDNQRLQAAAAVVQRFMPEHSATILDLGCANGGLLKLLKAHNYSKISGIDPSRACVRHVQSEGIRCTEGNIFSDSFISLPEKFDCIILSHVIEHIYDLSLAVANISSGLAENGIVYVEVPDASRYADYYTVPYYYIDCEHINHFGTDSLFNLFVPHGYVRLETMEIEINVTDSNKYPAVYAVFQKTTQNTTVKYSFSSRTSDSFRKFLEQSKSQDENVSVIQPLIQSQEPIIIWGAGQFTLRLLANSSLGKCNILGFIDSDSNKQGKTLMELPVHKPDYLVDHPCKVVICSALHYNEIKNTVNSLNSSIPVHILK